MQFLYEMNPELVERVFVMPDLKNSRSILGSNGHWDLHII